MHIFEKCLALVFSLMILGQVCLVRGYAGTGLWPAASGRHSHRLGEKYLL